MYCILTHLSYRYSAFLAINMKKKIRMSKCHFIRWSDSMMIVNIMLFSQERMLPEQSRNDLRLLILLHASSELMKDQRDHINLTIPMAMKGKLVHLQSNSSFLGLLDDLILIYRFDNDDNDTKRRYADIFAVDLTS
jgi:hypothetical protein